VSPSGSFWARALAPPGVGWVADMGGRAPAGWNRGPFACMLECRARWEPAPRATGIRAMNNQPPQQDPSGKQGSTGKEPSGDYDAKFFEWFKGWAGTPPLKTRIRPRPENTGEQNPGHSPIVDAIGTAIGNLLVWCFRLLWWCLRKLAQLLSERFIAMLGCLAAA